MLIMPLRSLTILLLAGLASAAWAEDANVYQNDFNNHPIGSVPTDFLVLQGEFAVKESERERFLELPGTPLETFGLLFGPARKDNVEATARFWGTRKGRLTPSFGLGLNGVGGYEVRVNPSRRTLELFHEDQRVAEHSFRWKSGKWTHLTLRVRRAGKAKVWFLEAKAWQEGAKEPEHWMIARKVSEPSFSGRAVLYGSPYAGTTIRFDDLKIMAIDKTAVKNDSREK